LKYRGENQLEYLSSIIVVMSIMFEDSSTCLSLEVILSSLLYSVIEEIRNEQQMTRLDERA